MLNLSRRFALQASIGAAFAVVPLSRALSQPSSSTADALSMMKSDPRFFGLGSNPKIYRTCSIRGKRSEIYGVYSDQYGVSEIPCSALGSETFP